MNSFQSFLEVRTRYRKYILAKAKVPHVPEELINSNIWGPNIFPDAVMDKLKARSIADIKSVLDQWDICSAFPQAFPLRIPAKGDLIPIKLHIS